MGPQPLPRAYGTKPMALKTIARSTNEQSFLGPKLSKRRSDESAECRWCKLFARPFHKHPSAISVHQPSLQLSCQRYNISDCTSLSCDRCCCWANVVVQQMLLCRRCCLVANCFSRPFINIPVQLVCISLACDSHVSDSTGCCAADVVLWQMLLCGKLFYKSFPMISVTLS